MNARPHEGDEPDAAGDGAEVSLLRAALREEAFALEPSAWPAREILSRAAKRRRARRIAFALPAAAAVACAAVLTLGRTGPADHVRMVPGSSAVSPSPSPSASASTPPAVNWPSVRVVSPGRTLDLGHGQRMRLETTERCVSIAGGGGWNCKSVIDGNQPAGTVSMQVEGTARGDALYTPLYLGPGTPTRMTVTVSGHVYPLQVVTLPGHPRYATGYGWVPSAPSPWGPQPQIRVYDAAGKLLASLIPPTCEPVTPTAGAGDSGGTSGECHPAGH